MIMRALGYTANLLGIWIAAVALLCHAQIWKVSCGFNTIVNDVDDDGISFPAGQFTYPYLSVSKLFLRPYIASDEVAVKPAPPHTK